MPSGYRSCLKATSHPQVASSRRIDQGRGRPTMLGDMLFRSRDAARITAPSILAAAATMLPLCIDKASRTFKHLPMMPAEMASRRLGYFLFR